MVWKGQGQESLWLREMQSIFFSDINLWRGEALLGISSAEGFSALCDLAARMPAKLEAQEATWRAEQQTEKEGEKEEGEYRPRERTDRYIHNWAVRHISKAELGGEGAFGMLFTDKGHHSPAVETMTAQHG